MIYLGFVEDNYNSRLLTSKYFPSKIGGFPAWLSKELPNFDKFCCTTCGQPMIFLLQIYAESTKSAENAFHRTLFVFLCLNSSCHSDLSSGAQTFAVLRSQLPRENPYYDSKPPDYENITDDDADFESTLCVVCGLPGAKQCSRCHTTRYCCRSHQAYHWKAEHREKCGAEVPTTRQPSDVLFDEVALVLEPEEIKVDDLPMEDVDIDGNNDDNDEDDEDMSAATIQPDERFAQFRKRVDANPEQVLRYDRDGAPLLISSANQPPAAIPVCERCGSARSFEFQVMPQLLSHLDIDSADPTKTSIDWGVLLIYTCSVDCDIGVDYATEFVWRQDPTGPTAKDLARLGEAS